MRRLARSVGVAAACAIAMSNAAAAQWINIRLPGTPRTSDGKPDLSAPAPHAAGGVPDLSGIWIIDRPDTFPRNGVTGLEYYVPPGFEFPFTAAGRDLYNHRRYDLIGAGRPSDHCLPHSVPDAMLPPTPYKVVQHPGLTLILYEEFTQYRQVFTDGRTFPDEMAPTWFGYSVGHWDGDTFVVDSKGFNDKTWLDDSGHPHSDAMHAIERFHRRDFGHMDLQVTIDDPKMYTRPWSVSLKYMLLPDTELIEFVCENEKDSQHFVK